MYDWDDPFAEHSELEQVTEDLYRQAQVPEEIDAAIDAIKPPVADNQFEATDAYGVPLFPTYETDPFWLAIGAWGEVGFLFRQSR